MAKTDGIEPLYIALFSGKQLKILSHNDIKEQHHARLIIKKSSVIFYKAIIAALHPPIKVLSFS